MFELKADNFYEAFRPLHSYSKIFGLTCFSLRKTTDGKYEVFLSCSDILLLTLTLLYRIITCILLVFFKDIFDNEYHKQLSMGSVFTYWFSFVMFVTTVGPICNTIWTVLYRKKFEEIFNLFLAVDDQVGSCISISKQH